MQVQTVWGWFVFFTSLTGTPLRPGIERPLNAPLEEALVPPLECDITLLSWKTCISTHFQKNPEEDFHLDEKT